MHEPGPFPSIAVAPASFGAVVAYPDHSEGVQKLYLARVESGCVVRTTPLVIADIPPGARVGRVQLAAGPSKSIVVWEETSTTGGTSVYYRAFGPNLCD